jgi:hypothetical protein
VSVVADSGDSAGSVGWGNISEYDTRDGIGIRGLVLVLAEE